MRKLLVLFLAVFAVSACTHDDDYDDRRGGRYYHDRDDYGYGGYYPYGRADYPRDRIWIIDGYRGCRYYSYQGYCYRYKEDYYRAIEWDRKHGYDDNWHKKRKAWCNKHDCRRDHDDRYDDRRDDRREPVKRGFAPVAPKEQSGRDQHDSRERDQGRDRDREHDRDREQDRGGWWGREPRAAEPVGRTNAPGNDSRSREREERRSVQPVRPVERDTGSLNRSEERVQPSRGGSFERPVPAEQPRVEPVQRKQQRQQPVDDSSAAGSQPRERKGMRSRQGETGSGE